MIADMWEWQVIKTIIIPMKDYMKHKHHSHDQNYLDFSLGLWILMIGTNTWEHLFLLISCKQVPRVIMETLPRENILKDTKRGLIFIFNENNNGKMEYCILYILILSGLFTTPGRFTTLYTWIHWDEIAGYDCCC